MSASEKSNGDWSPPGFIVGCAKQLLANPLSRRLRNTSEYTTLVQRLCMDRRMQAVWRQLLRSKGPKKFYYSPRAGLIDADFRFLEKLDDPISRLERMGLDPDKLGRGKSLLERDKDSFAFSKEVTRKFERAPAVVRQEHACVRFFSSAVVFATSEMTVFTDEELDLAMRELRFIADNLESSSRLAAEFLRNDVPSEVDLMVERLRKSAGSFETQRKSRLLVKRRRSDDRLRAFVIRLNETAQEIFGRQLNGLIAIICNVAFEKTDITTERVREMVRARSKRDWF